MLRSNSFLKRTVWTPLIALTTCRGRYSLSYLSAAERTSAYSRFSVCHMSNGTCEGQQVGVNFV